MFSYPFNMASHPLQASVINAGCCINECTSPASYDLKNIIVFIRIFYNKIVKAPCWNLKLSFYYLKQILCCYFCFSGSALTQAGTWYISFQNNVEIALLLGDFALRENWLFAIV